jgi:hypothetical protein
MSNTVDIDDEIQVLKMSSRIDSLLNLALKDQTKAFNIAIEPIGNDDATTKALIELLSLARVDEVEDPTHDRYSAKVAHVRNNCRLVAFKKLTEAADAYYASVLENIIE